MFKTLLVSTSALLIASSLTTNVYAHVTVKPSEVKVGQYQNFTVSVPPEKNTPTTEVKLLIPEGLESVRPNVKPGWKIEIKSEAEKVKEIVWTGGSIPPNQRDEFIFSAKVPTQATKLNWKAYQTYQDGSVVAWDHDPAQSKDEHEDESTGPFSVTQVVNDIDIKPTEAPAKPPEAKTDATVSLIALAVATAALVLSLRKK